MTDMEEDGTINGSILSEVTRAISVTEVPDDDDVPPLHKDPTISLLDPIDEKTKPQTDYISSPDRSNMELAPLEKQKEHTNKFPVWLEWKNLHYRVPDREDKRKIKHILKGLNGHIAPGELVAIMGPSGSGKSTFLNCLADRNQDGLRGEILFNKCPRPPNHARFTGYVTQDDVYFESLTVKETLLFASQLKLPKELSEYDRKMRVEEVLDELDLRRCENTKIGQVGKGISGGERRRLSVALEVLNEPSLLLLDEPTTGLDSASAFMIGKILKKLCKKKKLTIIATIHQPRYDLCAMFSKIYFLAQGTELYFGPTIPDCLPFFKLAGYPCPQYENPADFLLDLVNTNEEVTKNNAIEPKQETLAGGNIKNENQNLTNRKKIIEDIAKYYKNSEYRKFASEYDLPKQYFGNQLFTQVNSNFYITPVWNQIYVVCRRSFLHKFREPIAVGNQLFTALFVPLLFGSVYFQINTTERASLDRFSALSLLLLMGSFFAMNILLLFPTERDIFNRENASGMYRPISFFIGRTTAELPVHIVLTVIMGSIAYWLYGLQANLNKFLIFLAIYELQTLAGSGMMLLSSSISATFDQANLLSTSVLILMLFDGNWLSLNEIPVYYEWVLPINFMYYAGKAINANEYRGLTFKCTNKELQAANCAYEDGKTSGEKILKERGMANTDIFYCCMMLIMLNIVYRIIAFLGVWLLYRPYSASFILKRFLGLDKAEREAELARFVSASVTYEKKNDIELVENY